jgi:hypothetical protein
MRKAAHTLREAEHQNPAMINHYQLTSMIRQYGPTFRARLGAVRPEARIFGRGTAAATRGRAP